VKCKKCDNNNRKEKFKKEWNQLNFIGICGAFALALCGYILGYPPVDNVIITLLTYMAVTGLSLMWLIYEKLYYGVE
jgi:hypothetical protein